MFQFLAAILLVIIVIAGIAGYLIWNKPHQNIKDATGLPFDAVTLYAAFANNTDQKNAALINQVLIVSGEVKDVVKNQQGKAVILFKTNVDGGSVNCTLEEKENGIKRGDRIYLKGVCMGYIGGDKEMGLPGDVFLTRCYQVKL